MIVCHRFILQPQRVIVPPRIETHIVATLYIQMENRELRKVGSKNNDVVIEINYLRGIL